MTPVPTATAESEHEKLFALFKASDEASLQRNPLNAISRGDLRYADRLGDNITDAYYAAELAAEEADDRLDEVLGDRTGAAGRLEL